MNVLISDLRCKTKAKTWRKRPPQSQKSKPLNNSFFEIFDKRGFRTVIRFSFFVFFEEIVHVYSAKPNSSPNDVSQTMCEKQTEFH